MSPFSSFNPDIKHTLQEMRSELSNIQNVLYQSKIDKVKERNIIISPKPDPGVKKKILIVHDSPSMPKLMRFYFGKHLDCDVDVARKGKAGLEMFGKNSYILIITDIDMPVMNGVEFTKNVRDVDKETPIMVISADRTTGHDLMRTGFINIFFSAPYKPKEVVSKIQELLESKPQESK